MTHQPKDPAYTMELILRASEMKLLTATLEKASRRINKKLFNVKTDKGYVTERMSAKAVALMDLHDLIRLVTNEILGRNPL